MGRKSLVARLTVTNIALVLVPFAVIVYLVVGRLADAALREQDSAAHYATRNVQAAIEDRIDALSSISRSLIMSGSIRGYSAAASRVGDEGYEAAFARAAETLGLFVYQDKAISGIGFFPRSGKAVTAGFSPEAELSGEDRARAEELLGGWFWSASDGKVSMCRLVRNIYDFSDWLGYLVISIDRKEFARLLVPSYSSDDLSFALIDGSGAAIAHGLDPEQARLLAEGSAGSRLEPGGAEAFLGRTGDSTGYVAWATLLKDGRTRLVTVEKDKAGAYDRQYRFIAALATLLVLLTSLAQVGLYRRMLFKPLNRLRGLMKSIEEEDFSARFDSGVSDEISQLVDQFNRMSEKLRFLHEEVYRSSLKQKEAELKALQAEINPHFLFNTLDTIYWTASLGKAEQAGDMIRQLSTMFRLSLGEAEDGLVPLEKEVEHTRCYLALQRQRFDGRLAYSIDLQEGLGDLMVLKLALQPIVENAVLHGLEPRGGGEIIVSIDAAEGSLVYRIYDDGVGVDRDAINRLLAGGEGSRKAEGMALLNINERIRLKFGAEYGISAQSPGDGGSVFVVRQPARARGAA